nr:molecular chaperone [Pseudomonas carbonaria]
MRLALAGLGLLFSLDVQAGVTAERTRVIFHEGQREASLLLVNLNPYPVVTQAWIDDGALDSTPETAQAPLLPLPPLFRLEPGQQRSLRLLPTGQALPRDRETLYWLNLYEIPPQPNEPLEAGQSRLTVTLRTQMKVLYRPRDLSPRAEEAPTRLAFSLDGDQLRVENPTPYFVTLASLQLLDGSDRLQIPGELLSPFSQQPLPLPHRLPATASDEIRFTWIDDDGNSQEGRARLH